MTNDEVIRLVLQIQGERDVRDLTEEIDAQKKSLMNLHMQYHQGEIDHPTFIAQATAKATKLKDLQTSLAAAEKAAGKARSGMAGLGQSAMQTGRFMQDFAQGGVGGVLNNIEGLAMALGGGPGLAGVMTAVGLAAYFATPYLKELFKSIDGKHLPEVTAETDRLKGRIEELQKLGPTRLAVEAAELDSAQRKVDALTKAKQALDALMTRQTEAERESGQEVERSLTGADARAATGRMVDALAANNEANDPELAKARKQRAEALADLARETPIMNDKSRGLVDRAAAEAIVNAAKDRNDEANDRIIKLAKAARDKAEAEVGATIDEATKGVGKGQAEAQRKLARGLEAAGAGPLAQAVRDFSQGEVDDAIRAKKEIDAIDAHMPALDAEIKEALAEHKKKQQDAIDRNMREIDRITKEEADEEKRGERERKAAERAAGKARRAEDHEVFDFLDDFDATAKQVASAAGAVGKTGAGELVRGALLTGAAAKGPRARAQANDAAQALAYQAARDAGLDEADARAAGAELVAQQRRALNRQVERRAEEIRANPRQRARGMSPEQQALRESIQNGRGTLQLIQAFAGNLDNLIHANQEQRRMIEDLARKQADQLRRTNTAMPRGAR